VYLPCDYVHLACFTSASCAQVARRIAITSSAKGATKRAEKLAKIAKGEKVGPKRSAATKKVGDG
jgi:hypothetical protein